jgi:hypothetical protein
MRFIEIFEDQPRRHSDPTVEPWLKQAMQRPDAKQLYLHGSQKRFEVFNQPTTAYGHLIFGTKLIDEWRHDKILQAEYYGGYLYLVKFHFKNLFNPYSDPVAKRILTDALTHSDVWDAEHKIKYGRVDYEDLHLIVPPAVAAGYDAFRVYEVSIRGDSYAVVKPDQVEIVDRCHPNPAGPTSRQ